ncbi:MAG: HAD-IA family hydrolase [Candidatus Woesearchaeota archaeon]|nr:HAD-IA family hydrolase [Candidatus Woesearchaeota archaeon]
MIHLIFDFDGTIADSFDINLRIVNKILKKYDARNISKEEVRNREINDILKELKIPAVNVPSIIKEVVVELKKENLKPFKGMPEVLKTLSSKYRLCIITANSKDNAEKFLKKNKLEMFDFVHSTILLSKYKAIEKAKKDFNILHGIYIGDETRDIESARKAGMRCVAVTWGYNSKELLMKHDPEYIIDKPAELLKLEF